MTTLDKAKVEADLRKQLWAVRQTIDSGGRNEFDPRELPFVLEAALDALAALPAQPVAVSDEMVETAWGEAPTNTGDLSRRDLRRMLASAFALAAPSQQEGEPTSFVWTENLYAAMNAIQGMKSHPRFGELLAAWKALNEAALVDRMKP